MDFEDYCKKNGFLLFSITKLMVQFFVGGGGENCSVHWRIFISIIKLYSVDANNTNSPWNQPKLSPEFSKCLLRGKIIPG